MMNGGERTCFLESSENGGLGRWIWFMYAMILARSVEEATSSLRRGFWWKRGNDLERGGDLYNLRLCQLFCRSPMAVAEGRKQEAGDSRDGKISGRENWTI